MCSLAQRPVVSGAVLTSEAQVDETEAFCGKMSVLFDRAPSLTSGLGLVSTAA